MLAKLGRKKEALAVLETLESLAKDRYIPPYAAALVHAGLDQPDAVFRWRDRALECHDVHLVLLPADPKWDVCRADSRFLDLLKRCGLPHSNSLTH